MTKFTIYKCCTASEGWRYCWPAHAANGNLSKARCCGAAEAEVRQRPDGLVQDDAGVVENFLDFGGYRSTLVSCQRTGG